MMRQASAWETIFSNRIPNKELVSRVYKELSKINSIKKQTIQLEHEQKTQSKKLD